VIFFNYFQVTCVYYANIYFQLISSDTCISKGGHYYYALKLVKCIISECEISNLLK
jgi:hypothetical protein